MPKKKRSVYFIPDKELLSVQLTMTKVIDFNRYPIKSIDAKKRKALAELKEESLKMLKKIDSLINANKEEKK